MSITYKAVSSTVSVGTSTPTLLTSYNKDRVYLWVGADVGDFVVGDSNVTVSTGRTLPAPLQLSDVAATTGMYGIAATNCTATIFEIIPA